MPIALPQGSWTGLGGAFLSMTVLIAGTGYCVDMFDFLLFNMVRIKSLTDLGLTAEQATQAGIQIINAQLAGLIIGAYLWGTLADRFGRKRVVLGSILTYSLASLLTAFVQSEWLYGLLRFITGIGLAGELGAGIALISEKFSDNRRGLGVGIFIILGFVGVLLASGAAQVLPWRMCYVVGGFLGFSLLLFRMLIKESLLFQKSISMVKRRSELNFGGLKPIFANASQRAKYVCGILLLLPTVFIPQILWSLSPEIAKAKGIIGIDSASMLGLGYGCVIAGDLLAIVLAEKLKDRKRTIMIFFALGCVPIALFLWGPIWSAEWFYLVGASMGITFGSWVVGASMIAEMFGTNVRATATTTIPNFSRGCVILMNACLMLLKPMLGIQAALTVIGSVIIALAILALYFLKDTYGRDLDYVE